MADTFTEQDYREMAEKSIFGWDQYAVERAQAMLRQAADQMAGVQEMAVEYHALLNEPMYAGTRADWKARAMAAEAALADQMAAQGRLVERWRAFATRTRETESQLPHGLMDETRARMRGLADVAASCADELAALLAPEPTQK